MARESGSLAGCRGGSLPFLLLLHCSLHNFCEDLETEDPADLEVWNMQLEDDPVLIRLGLA